MRAHSGRRRVAATVLCLVTVACGGRSTQQERGRYGRRVRALFDNPRFVTGCECPREIKRLTTCGWDPNGHGGGSACE